MTAPLNDTNRATAENDEFELVTVTIGGQLFGIPVDIIQDVFQPQAITHVPLAAPEIDGVLNLRGRIVTAIDVRHRLGLQRRDRSTTCMAVGIEKNHESFGLLIDQVGEVIKLSQQRVEANPPNLDPRWRDVSKGVCRLEGQLLIIMDVQRVLDFDRRSQAA